MECSADKDLSFSSGLWSQGQDLGGPIYGSFVVKFAEREREKREREREMAGMLVFAVLRDAQLNANFLALWRFCRLQTFR